MRVESVMPVANSEDLPQNDRRARRLRFDPALSLGLLSLLVLGALAIHAREYERRPDQRPGQLAALHMALCAYHSDTGASPRSLLDLLVADGRPGWNGPYITLASLAAAQRVGVTYAHDDAAPARIVLLAPAGAQRAEVRHAGNLDAC